MTFAEKILLLRKEKGWTQEMLAEKINISRQALSKWEAGGVLPDTENVLQLSKLFGVTTDYLLKDECETPVVTNSVIHSKTKNDWALWGVGLSLCLSSAFCVLIMRILASIFPASHGVAEAGGETIVYHGLRAFLLSNDLVWLFWLCVIAFSTGLISCLYHIGKKFRDKEQH